MKKIFYSLCFVSSTLFAQDSILDSYNSLSGLNTADTSGQIFSNNDQFCDGNLLLDQKPNQVNGFFSDIDCDFCTSASNLQFVADNFVLTTDNSLGQFVIYAGYFPDNLPVTDSWSLTVHDDNAGIPGNVIYTENDVFSTRTDTGVDLFGVDEYRIVLTPSSAIPLNAGTYWLEIHNDSAGSSESVFWESGDLDSNSIAGNAFAHENPVVTWNNDTVDLAVQICQEAFNLDINVTGLAATNTVAVTNAKDVLSVSTNGSHTVTALSVGSAYSLSVTQQPDTPNQVCTITSGNASGSMTSSGVSVDIECTTTQYNVDVSVTGLAATNSVSFSNGGDSLTISTDGTETISTLNDESAFDVDITAQPDTPNQVCSFDNADSGNLAGGDATVNVSCVTTQYTVGVDVSGLAAGNSVVFQNNAGDDLTASTDGISTFATALDDGSAYNVTVLTQPTSPNQTCLVSNPASNLSGNNVSLTVTCTTTQYNVDINVSGLAATNSVSFSNGGDSLTISTDGTETISTIDDETVFDVDITAQPDTPNQVCSFDNADSGTLAGANATVNVSCVTTQYTVGVDVSGLAAGNSVVFQNNAGDDLTASTDGISTFATALDDGSAYNVTVLTQPTTPNQTCLVSNPASNLSGSNVSLTVTCTTTQYNVDVNVSGLAATNSVSFSNGGDSLTISTDGTETISTLNDESAFDVDITAQPDTPNQVCSFDNADSGTLAGANATVNVSCVTTQYTVGVDVSGLAAGNSVVFQNNSGDDLTASTDGISTFATALDDESAYNVSVLTQPTAPNQTCVVSSPMGNLAGSNINLTVTCATAQYTVDVNVSGMADTNEISFANDSDTLTVTADGNNTLSTLDDGTAYAVSITSAQPDSPDQVCSITSGNASGTLSGANVTIDVSCVTTQYPIYVIVSGLAANNSVTFTNGTDSLTVSDSEFNIISTLDDGSAYDVSISTQPTTPNQVCTILSGNASGTLNGAHEELHVDCEIVEYFIGGNVTGLLKNSMLILQNNGQETEIITCNGPFVFNTPQNDLTSYSISVHTNPQSPVQECTLTQDSGTISGNDVISVEVDCDHEISGDYLFSNGFNGSPFCVPIN